MFSVFGTAALELASNQLIHTLKIWITFFSADYLLSCCLKFACRLLLFVSIYLLLYTSPSQGQWMNYIIGEGLVGNIHPLAEHPLLRCWPELQLCFLLILFFVPSIIISPFIIIIIIIIIKNGQQCKAGKEWYTPYQSEDPSSTIPTYRQKEEKGKESRRL